MNPLSHAGYAPVPGELFERFSVEPWLLMTLAVVALVHTSLIPARRARCTSLAGWWLAIGALASPLVTLGDALFSARIAQQAVLVLLAAPLIAGPTPATPGTAGRATLWTSATAFVATVWFWHLPTAYEWSASSTATGWAMQATLFASALVFWHNRLHATSARRGEVLAIGLVVSLQLGVLGAMIAFAGRPLYLTHLLSAPPWGLSVAADQSLGGWMILLPCVIFVVLTTRRLIAVGHKARRAHHPLGARSASSGP